MTQATIASMSDDDAACMRMIHALRAEEGDSVEVLCDNPDPFEELDNNAVLCCGDWTGWVIRRFRGKSLRAALEAACKARGVKV